jgi:hypothetical protein
MAGAGMSLAGIPMILAAVYEISGVFSEWGWLALSFWYVLSALILLPGLGILYDSFASKRDADYVEQHADQIERLKKVEISSGFAIQYRSSF